MTNEQLESEERVLKEKIEKAVTEFFKVTGCAASGEFRFDVSPVPSWSGLSAKRILMPTVTIRLKKI